MCCRECPVLTRAHACSCCCRILTDLPFGKQFGTVQGNETLYPRVLAELARVVRCGGRAVLLTSADNDATMQAALASAMHKNMWIQLCSKQSTTETQGIQPEPRAPARSGAWEVLHRYGFMLFCSMRARVYVLRRTAAPAPRPDEAEACCCANLDTLRAWARHSQLVRPRSCQASVNTPTSGSAKDNGKCDEFGSGTVSAGGAPTIGLDNDTPDSYVERLSGACSKLPWDDGSGWRKQWMRARPPMVAYSG